MFGRAAIALDDCGIRIGDASRRASPRAVDGVRRQICGGIEGIFEDGEHPGRQMSVERGSGSADNHERCRSGARERRMGREL